MTFIEEDIIFRLIADIGGEILAYDAVPIGPVGFIEFLFDMFRYLILDFDIFNGPFRLNALTCTYLIASAAIPEL